MKKMLIIIGLMAVVATVHGQSKQSKKQVQPQQDRMYEVKFTKGGLDLLNNKIDSAANKISNSTIPARDANKVISVLFEIRNVFNEEYQKAQKDTVKGK